MQRWVRCSWGCLTWMPPPEQVAHRVLLRHIVESRLHRPRTDSVSPASPCPAAESGKDHPPCAGAADPGGSLRWCLSRPQIGSSPPSEHLIKPGRLTGLSVKKHSRNPEGFEIISLFYQNTTEQNVGFVVVVLLIKPEVVWFKRHAELTRVWNWKDF